MEDKGRGGAPCKVKVLDFYMVLAVGVHFGDAMQCNANQSQCRGLLVSIKASGHIQT